MLASVSCQCFLRSVNRCELWVPRPWALWEKRTRPRSSRWQHPWRQAHKLAGAKGDPGWWGPENKQGTELRCLPKTGAQKSHHVNQDLKSKIKQKRWQGIAFSQREWNWQRPSGQREWSLFRKQRAGRGGQKAEFQWVSED